MLARSRAGFRLHRVIGRDAETGKIVTRGDAGLQNDEPSEIVLGKVISIERKQRRVSLETPGTKICTPFARRRGARRWPWRTARRERGSSPRHSYSSILALFLYAAPAAAQADLQTTVRHRSGADHDSGRRPDHLHDHGDQ